MKATRSILYRFENGAEVEFQPVTDCPGYTYRVIVNRRRAGWVAKDGKTTLRAANYWLTKATEGTEAANRLWDTRKAA